MRESGTYKAKFGRGQAVLTVAFMTDPHDMGEVFFSTSAMGKVLVGEVPVHQVPPRRCGGGGGGGGGGEG